MAEINVIVDKDQYVFRMRRNLVVAVLTGQDVDLVFMDEEHEKFYLANVASPSAALLTEFFGMDAKDPEKKPEVPGV